MNPLKLIILDLRIASIILIKPINIGYNNQEHEGNTRHAKTAQPQKQG